VGSFVVNGAETGRTGGEEFPKEHGAPDVPGCQKEMKQGPGDESKRTRREGLKRADEAMRERRTWPRPIGRQGRDSWKRVKNEPIHAPLGRGGRKEKKRNEEEASRPVNAGNADGVEKIATASKDLCTKAKFAPLLPSLLVWRDFARNGTNILRERFRREGPRTAKTKPTSAQPKSQHQRGRGCGGESRKRIYR